MSETNRTQPRLLALAALLVAGLASCQPDAPTAPRALEPSFAKGGGGPRVDAADPPAAPQDITLDVRVLGSGFDNGSVASWTIDGVPQPEVRTNHTVFVSRNELVANITIQATAPIDLYDIEVLTSRGKKGIGADLFSVLKKGTPTFTMVELAPTHGGDLSFAKGMNNQGQIVGSSWFRRDAFDRPSLWTVAADLSVEATELEMLPGWVLASAEDVSEEGIIVGVFMTDEGATGSGPAAWVNGNAAALSDGGTGRGRVTAVTDFGGSWFAVGGIGQSWSEAAYWEGWDEPVSLMPIEPGAYSVATAVNSVGTIAGYSGESAVVWKRARAADGAYYYGPPCELESDARAHGISEPDAGVSHIAGVWNYSVEEKGAVWTIDEGGPDCGSVSTRHLDEWAVLRDVNVGEDAVGEGTAMDAAIIWTSAGDVFELPGLDKSGTASLRAMAISRDGQWMVGHSMSGGRPGSRAVLWIRE